MAGFRECSEAVDKTVQLKLLDSLKQGKCHRKTENMSEISDLGPHHAVTRRVFDLHRGLESFFMVKS